MRDPAEETQKILTSSSMLINENKTGFIESLCYIILYHIINFSSMRRREKKEVFDDEKGVSSHKT